MTRRNTRPDGDTSADLAVLGQLDPAGIAAATAAEAALRYRDWLLVLHGLHLLAGDSPDVAAGIAESPDRGRAMALAAYGDLSDVERHRADELAELEVERVCARGLGALTLVAESIGFDVRQHPEIVALVAVALEIAVQHDEVPA